MEIILGDCFFFPSYRRQRRLRGFCNSSKPLSCKGFTAATGSCGPWDVVSTRLGRTGEETVASGSQVYQVNLGKLVAQ